MAGDEFGALLGELKERSGLSYGVLGKRLHMSGSTLHRYVNADAVPTDYAPIERFARLCKATPDELLTLHRLWLRADALRGRKAEPEAVATAEAVAKPEPKATPEPATTEPEAVPDPPAAPAGRRRTVALAGAAVVAVAGAIALAVNLVPGDGRGDGERQTVGAVSSSDAAAGKPSASGRTSPSASAGRSASPTPSGSAAATAPTGGGAQAPSPGRATAPSVVADAHKWEHPCSQHYLVNRPPAQVPPPPTEQDAPGWVAALDAVTGGDQRVALTVQGTGKQTVVLDALHVRVVNKSAPLAWNDYSMGVGCGGDVPTKNFAVDLDSGRPGVTPKAGQRNFPYKVSESDPEVFYVTAQARAHDVSWFLELDWSSGDQRGTVRIDDDGQPFRTSGRLGRPGYDYPLGGSEWIEAPKN